MNSLKKKSIVTAPEASPVREFLSTRKVSRAKGAAPATVTGMGEMLGSWTVADEDYEDFLRLLYEHNFVKNARSLGLVEQSRPDTPRIGLIDLDFRYPAGSALTRRFTVDAHLRPFVVYHARKFLKYFDLDCHTEGAPVRFFVLLRPGPYEDRGTHLIKDGVHIMCPDLRPSTEIQQGLRMEALRDGILATIFGNTSYINADTAVYDESVAKKQGWFFHGESKPNIPAYRVAAVYTVDTGAAWEDEDEDPLVDATPEEVAAYDDWQLVKLLSIRRVDAPELTEDDIRDSMRDEWEDATAPPAAPSPARPSSPHSSRTSVASSGGRNGEVTAAAGAADALENQIAAEFYKKVLGDTSANDAELAKQLVLRCLSAERATDYNTWMEVGWCLRNISGSEEMFQLWMTFSEKSPKYSKNNLSKLRHDWTTNWGNLCHPNPLTMGSLKHWARTDNPAEYAVILKENNVQYIYQNLHPTHTHFARLMHRIYKGQYCAHVEKKAVEWFGYGENVWRHIKQGVELKCRLMTDVAGLVEEAKKIARAQINITGEVDERAEKKLELLTAAEKKLYDHGFKEGVLKDSIGFFMNEDFINKLNTAPFLLGTPNGVIDLQARVETPEESGDAAHCGSVPVLRPGQPEDYVSFLVGRDPNHDALPFPVVSFDPDAPEQREIEDFLHKIFPDKDIFEFMDRFTFPSYLEGRNREQTWQVWNGVGGNGKTMLVMLISSTLGDYAQSMQSTVITRKRPDSNSANPDVIVLRNKRFIYSSEPDDGEPLNMSRIKHMTGGDVVEARGLYEDQQNFPIRGHIVLLCNHLPAITAVDRGIWRRTLAIPFASRFVGPGDSDWGDLGVKPNVFAKDPDLENKILRWRPHFLARLLHNYQHYYTRHEVRVPEVIKRASDEYRSQYDSFGQFCTDRIRTVVGEDTSVKQAYKIYRVWAGINASHSRLLAAKEFEKRMELELGRAPEGGVYRHKKVFDNDEDVAEFDRSLKRGAAVAGAAGAAASAGAPGGEDAAWPGLA